MAAMFQATLEEVLITYNMNHAWQIELFRRQYLQLQDPEHLTIPSPDALKNADNQAFLFHSMFRDGCLNFPPPDRYKTRVLKKVIEAIENAMEDPEEDV